MNRHERACGETTPPGSGQIGVRRFPDPFPPWIPSIPGRIRAVDLQEIQTGLFPEGMGNAVTDRITEKRLTEAIEWNEIPPTLTHAVALDYALDLRDARRERDARRGVGNDLAECLQRALVDIEGWGCKTKRERKVLKAWKKLTEGKPR